MTTEEERTELRSLCEIISRAGSEPIPGVTIMDAANKIREDSLVTVPALLDENDELREALNSVVEWYDEMSDCLEDDPAMVQLKALLDKVKTKDERTEK